MTVRIPGAQPFYNACKHAPCCKRAFERITVVRACRFLATRHIANGTAQRYRAVTQSASVKCPFERTNKPTACVALQRYRAEVARIATKPPEQFMHRSAPVHLSPIRCRSVPHLPSALFRGSSRGLGGLRLACIESYPQVAPVVLPSTARTSATSRVARKDHVRPISLSFFATTRGTQSLD